MIRNITIIIGLFFITFILSGCVKDGLDECPAGRIKLNLYVEKFRNPSQDPLNDVEDNFSDRINHLRYYLYRDGELVEQNMVMNFTKSASSSYTLEFSDLDYGDYNMVVVGNCTKTALAGDPTVADNLVLTFPTCAETEDFFTATYPFKVNSNDVIEHDMGLLRTQGVIRYAFNNVPTDVSDIEVVVKNVCAEKWITGDYKTTCEASHRYLMAPLKNQKSKNDYIIGTFPTPQNEKSAYYIHVYRESDTTPYLEQLITDTMSVVRNQLVDIAVTFNGDALDFEINLDNKWDGSTPGGETGLE